MAGLLSGIGQVLAGGVAGGAKAAGESFVEQAKQEALAAREENMLRIQNLFAKEGRAETQKFQAGESKLGRESAKSLAESSQVNASILQGERLTSAENLAEVERLSRSEEAAAERKARVMAVKTATTTAKEFETFKAGLPGELKKKFDDLKNILGPEKAKDVFTDIISRKDTAYETIVAKMTKDIDPMDLTEDKVKKIAGIALTFAQLKTRETTAAPGESAFARAKREAAEKAAAGNPNVENPAPVETSGQQGTAYTFGGVGETGVPPGYSPREWNKMSPAEQDQARKDYVAKRKAQHKGLLTEKE